MMIMRMSPMIMSSVTTVKTRKSCFTFGGRGFFLPMIKGKDADEVDGESEDGDDEELFYFEDLFGPD
jgi:hypothetical protein